MSIRTKALKSLFTGKSYIQGTGYPVTVSSNTSLQVLRDFFSFGSEGNINKFIDAYGNNPLVYQIINRIATQTASIDVITVNNEGEKVEDGSVMELLNSPNETQTRIDFVTEVLVCYESCGNAYILHTEGMGMGNELTVLNPKQLIIELYRNGEFYRYAYTDSHGNTSYYDYNEVWHFKSENTVNLSTKSVRMGMSPLQANWMVVKSSNEKFSAEASIFKNRGIIGILTNKSDAPMLPKERERLQNEFDKEAGGAEKFNKIKISSSDLSYIQTGMSPTDLKLLEGILSSLRILCAAYKMPSVLFNDNEQSTYNNVSEAKKSAYVDAYLPLADKFYTGLSAWLSMRLGVTEEVTANINSIPELKASTNDVLQAILSMPERIQATFVNAMTIDELRALAPLEEINNKELVSTLSKTNETKQGEDKASEAGKSGEA